MNNTKRLPPPAKVNSFDEANTTCGAGLLAGSESMDVSNDPRFFTKNVVDKRLSAFKSLTIVSGLMVKVSIAQCFKMKQNKNFAKMDKYVGNIAMWEAAGFLISVVVAVMCLMSLYVMAHQLFYTYRLMTAGPTGFEQAAVFYLTRAITFWRHLAIKCLFNALWLLLVLVGIQLFVTFYDDADRETNLDVGGVHGANIGLVWAVNIVNGTSQNKTGDHWVVNLHEGHKLDMKFHAVLGVIVVGIFGTAAALFYYVRMQHLKVFQENYTSIKAMTDPIQQNMMHMSKRSSMSLDA